MNVSSDIYGAHVTAAGAGYTCGACPDGYSGTGDTAYTVSDGGCGCQSTDPRQASLVMLVLAICLRPRRRRSTSR